MIRGLVIQTHDLFVIRDKTHNKTHQLALSALDNSFAVAVVLER